ncbi:hypothetical protein NQ317_004744 [Molorchus minor]|uniref:Uncharacterized protein n=1 Tax=Molorchus minor TaxID=1323400 RepID=A0ABQ9JPY9_9CUCU|nr:hypothetical protein NQ317_004744 [Molorchus minor]
MALVSIVFKKTPISRFANIEVHLPQWKRYYRMLKKLQYKRKTPFCLFFNDVFSRFRWLRTLVRRNTNPIPVSKAELWKSRLSVVYMLVAWNAFGFVGYMIYSGKNDWAQYYGYKSEEEAKLSPGL